MANTKGALIRQKIIDRCLQSERGYSTKGMMDKCNDALEERGYPVVTSSNTIRDDITEICNAYHVTVELVNKGERSKRYRYEDRDFSVYSSPLTEKDTDVLNEIMQNLSLFQGRPQLEWLDDIRFRMQSSIDNASIVVYDDNPELKGIRFFQPLFDEIKQKHTLMLTYKTYKDDEKRVTIHPYMLRQYNKRWFLIALTEGYEKSLSNYALDRIVAFDIANTPYKQCTFDLDTYYNNVIGVSVPYGGKTENIELWVSRSLYPYIATKPIHQSQEEIGEEDGRIRIRLKLIPNYELEQLILSYGEGLKVLSPMPLREKIKERAEKTSKNYD